MKAIVINKFGGPEELQAAEIPVPQQPGKDEILVRIHAAGVNPVDSYIRQGYGGGLGLDIKTPFVPGIDGAGEVEAVGEGVTRFKKGDRVFVYLRDLQGTYAQYCLCPQNRVYSLPAKVTFQQGSALGVPYFTAYRALFQTAHSKSANSVLVHGASGGVGLGGVQLAKAAGKTVYGTAGTEAGLKLVKEAGADYVFNHREKDYVKKIIDATKGEGVDLILETNAHINIPNDIQIIKKRGIIAVIGSRGTTTIDPAALFVKSIAVIGIAVLDYPFDEMAAAGARIVNGLQDGSLNPVVDREYPLKDAPAAHKDIIESAGAKGKLVLMTDQ